MAILVGQLIEILQKYDQDIKVKHVIPTAHGYHLITIGFDTNQFAQQLAIRNLDSIDIQKDNPTLLYFDTAD